MRLSTPLSGSTPNWRYNCFQESRSGRFSEKARIGQPQVEIKAQRGPLERLEGVHVERHRVADDLVKEVFAEANSCSPTAPARRGAWDPTRTRYDWLQTN